MSSTLREQLLKAGLVTEKQVRATEQQQQRQQRPQPSRKQPPQKTEQQLAADRARAAKAARDAELNRQRELNAQAKARAAEIRQLIEQHKLPKVLDSEDRFNFVHGSKLRFILVDAALREGINNGSLCIVRFEGKSEIVPAAIADRIRQRDPRVVISLKDEPAPVDENDPYKDFVVPDDLKW
ncbi:MAG TPA: DUF2058 domain-containing protein [Steroidobacteraceae bacterium]|nr:DUF2058 domain-containing protein [Steroidobacteraceae bacterium]